MLAVKKILYCDNGDTCPYGIEDEDDNGNKTYQPEIAYSQQGSFMGLCLNCYDDWMKYSVCEPD